MLDPTSDRFSILDPRGCDCPCCDYDARLDRYHRAGGEGLLPDRPAYGARDLLECARFMADGDGSVHCSEVERTWWREHGEHLRAWLRERVDEGLECAHEAEVAKYGATTLLNTIAMRAVGTLSDGTSRPSFSWDEIDAYEVLFDYLAHIGIMEGWDEEVVVEGIRSFADYLGRQGVIEGPTHERLQAELEQWIPRILDFFDNGTWYTPNGKRVRC